MKNREITIKFRMKKGEVETLDSLAKDQGVDRSKYIRKLISAEKSNIFLRKEDIDMLQKQFENINRLGLNINQIAFNMNKDDVIKYDIKSAVMPIIEQATLSIRSLKSELVSLIRSGRN